MDPIVDTKDIDRDGVWHIGRGTRGCRHCGRTEVKYAQNGKAAYHHPGVICCERATQDQIAHRQEELRQLRRKALDARREVDDLHAQAEKAFGKDATDLRSRAQKAERGIALQTEQLRLLADGDPTREIVGLKVEIAELERHLGVLVRASSPALVGARR